MAANQAIVLTLIVCFSKNKSSSFGYLLFLATKYVAQFGSKWHALHDIIIA